MPVQWTQSYIGSQSMTDTSSNNHIHNPLFDRGITHDGLELVRDRFLKLNRERMLRTRTALLPRQQIFLDLLPLLIHINHPILPGYNSQSAPCGIDGYQPDDADAGAGAQKHCPQHGIPARRSIPAADSQRFPDGFLRYGRASRRF